MQIDTETQSIRASAISGAALGAVIALVIGPGGVVSILVGAALGAAAGVLLGKLILSLMLR
jgi:outer membrane lipoprotein SlyB